MDAQALEPARPLEDLPTEPDPTGIDEDGGSPFEALDGQGTTREPAPTIAAPFGIHVVPRPVPLDPKRTTIARLDLMVGPLRRTRPLDLFTMTSVENGRMHGFSGTFHTGFSSPVIARRCGHSTCRSASVPWPAGGCVAGRALPASAFGLGCWSTAPPPAPASCTGSTPTSASPSASPGASRPPGSASPSSRATASAIVATSAAVPNCAHDTRTASAWRLGDTWTSWFGRPGAGPHGGALDIMMIGTTWTTWVMANAELTVDAAISPNGQWMALAMPGKPEGEDQRRGDPRR